MIIKEKGSCCGKRKYTQNKAQDPFAKLISEDGLIVFQNI